LMGTNLEEGEETKIFPIHLWREGGFVSFFMGRLILPLKADWGRRHLLL